MREDVAGGGATHRTLRHSGVDVNRVKESAGCAQGDETVATSIFVPGVRDRRRDEGTTRASNRAGVIHFDRHRLGDEFLARRSQIHANEGGSSARKRGYREPDASLRPFSWVDDNRGLTHIPDLPPTRKTELCVNDFLRVAGVYYLEWNYDIGARLC